MTRNDNKISNHIGKWTDRDMSNMWSEGFTPGNPRKSPRIEKKTPSSVFPRSCPGKCGVKNPWNVLKCNTEKKKLELSSPVASQWGTWWWGLLGDDAFEVFLPAFQNWCVTWNLYKAERAMRYSLFYHLSASNICKLQMYGSIHDMHSLSNVIESSHTHTQNTGVAKMRFYHKVDYSIQA